MKSNECHAGIQRPRKAARCAASRAVRQQTTNYGAIPRSKSQSAIDDMALSAPCAHHHPQYPPSEAETAR